MNKKNKLIEIIIELAIIFSAANFLFYLQKTFEPSLWNLSLALIILIGAIWVKTERQ